MTLTSSLHTVQGMSFKDTHHELQFQPRMKALLQGATDLKALRLHLHGTESMSLLSSCSLKHLALHIPLKAFEGAWRGKFPDLRACPLLESLKVVATVHDRHCSYSGSRSTRPPDLSLMHMSKLRYIELEEPALPRYRLRLPPGCQLFARLSRPVHPIFFDDSGEVVSNQTTIMYLGKGSLYRIWQNGLARFQNLQLLVMNLVESLLNLPLELAIVQHIPHVRLLSEHPLCLALAEGSWQSLDIFCESSIHVAFTDVDAFVTGTKLFSFCCSDVTSLSDSPMGLWGDRKIQSPTMMMEMLQAACSKHNVECYRTSHLDSAYPIVQLKRLSNRKLRSPFDKGEEPSRSKSVFSQLARTQMLVSHEDFWPQDPCKALDCM